MLIKASGDLCHLMTDIDIYRLDIRSIDIEIGSTLFYTLYGYWCIVFNRRRKYISI